MAEQPILNPVELCAEALQVWLHVGEIFFRADKQN